MGAGILASLGEVCRLTGVRPDRWHLVPALARPFEMAATLRLAEQLRDAGDLSEKDAIREAAGRLGLEPDTAVTRAYRWFRDQYSDAA